MNVVKDWFYVNVVKDWVSCKPSKRLGFGVNLVKDWVFVNVVKDWFRVNVVLRSPFRVFTAIIMRNIFIGLPPLLATKLFANFRTKYQIKIKYRTPGENTSP